MKRLDYDNPGDEDMRARFKERLLSKTKEQLVEIVMNVAESCDMRGKGYVDRWEDTVRHDIGYK